MNVPASIRSALEGPLGRKPIGVRIPVARGQIRAIRHSPDDPVLTNEAPERMVLVVRVDTDQEFTEVMLVHPYVELGTSLDLVVTPEHSTTPYRTVIQTDTRAVVWTYQLDTLMGEFDPAALEALGDVATGRTVHRAGLYSGPPLRGPLDPRWEFKAQEGEAIRSLALDCTIALLNGESPLRFTPSHLGPSPLNTTAGSDATIDVVESATGRRYTLPIPDVGIDAMNNLMPEGTRSTLRSLGLDFDSLVWSQAAHDLATGSLIPTLDRERPDVYASTF